VTQSQQQGDPRQGLPQAPSDASSPSAWERVKSLVVTTEPREQFPLAPLQSFGDFGVWFVVKLLLPE
jgi:hypothetical protein